MRVAEVLSFVVDPRNSTGSEEGWASSAAAGVLEMMPELL